MVNQVMLHVGMGHLERFSERDTWMGTGDRLGQADFYAAN